MYCFPHSSLRGGWDGLCDMFVLYNDNVTGADVTLSVGIRLD